MRRLFHRRVDSSKSGISVSELWETTPCTATTNAVAKRRRVTSSALAGVRASQVEGGVNELVHGRARTSHPDRKRGPLHSPGTT
jgi:hypothetical protein